MLLPEMPVIAKGRFLSVCGMRHHFLQNVSVPFLLAFVNGARNSSLRDPRNTESAKRQIRVMADTDEPFFLTFQRYYSYGRSGKGKAHCRYNPPRILVFRRLSEACNPFQDAGGRETEGAHFR